MENITIEGLKLHDALTVLEFQIHRLHTIYSITEIYNNEALYLELNLGDKEKGAINFQDYYQKKLEYILTEFHTKTENSKQKSLISKEIASLRNKTKDYRNSLLEVLKDSYIEPFADNKFWNEDSELLRLYCVVCSVWLDAIPLILSELELKFIHPDIEKPTITEITTKDLKQLTSSQIYFIYKLLKKEKLVKVNFDAVGEQRFLSSISSFSSTTFRDSKDKIESIIDMTFEPKHSKAVLTHYILPIEKTINDTNEPGLKAQFEAIKTYFEKQIKS